MDRYEKIRVLGKGSFGSAILIRRKGDEALFVVKEIPLGQLSKKELAKARKECSVLQKLQHPNIVRYIEHFENRNCLYLVMEYCNDSDLSEKVKECRGAMKESSILYYFSQVCLAVKYLHFKHILHRDIKTMNVFLMKSGAVKIGDFGIATVLMNTVANAKTVCGTPYYFSPELCQKQPYNSKSDIWSLGVLLYECATGGRHPFVGSNMSQLMYRIVKKRHSPLPSNAYSPEFRNLVDWCLQKDPARRPSIHQILSYPLIWKFLETLENQLLLATQHRAGLKDLLEDESHSIELFFRSHPRRVTSSSLQPTENPLNFSCAQRNEKPEAHREGTIGMNRGVASSPLSTSSFDVLTKESFSQSKTAKPSDIDVISPHLRKKMETPLHEGSKKTLLPATEEENLLSNDTSVEPLENLQKCSGKCRTSTERLSYEVISGSELARKKEDQGKMPRKQRQQDEAIDAVNGDSDGTHQKKKTKRRNETPLTARKQKVLTMENSDVKPVGLKEIMKGIRPTQKPRRHDTGKDFRLRSPRKDNRISHLRFKLPFISNSTSSWSSLMDGGSGSLPSVPSHFLSEGVGMPPLYAERLHHNNKDSKDTTIHRSTMQNYPLSTPAKTGVRRGVGDIQSASPRDVAPVEFSIATSRRNSGEGLDHRKHVKVHTRCKETYPRCDATPVRDSSDSVWGQKAETDMEKGRVSDKEAPSCTHVPAELSLSSVPCAYSSSITSSSVLLSSSTSLPVFSKVDGEANHRINDGSRKERKQHLHHSPLLRIAPTEAGEKEVSLQLPRTRKRNSSPAPSHPNKRSETPKEIKIKVQRITQPCAPLIERVSDQAAAHGRGGEDPALEKPLPSHGTSSKCPRSVSTKQDVFTVPLVGCVPVLKDPIVGGTHPLLGGPTASPASFIMREGDGKRRRTVDAEDLTPSDYLLPSCTRTSSTLPLSHPARSKVAMLLPTTPSNATVSYPMPPSGSPSSPRPPRLAVGGEMGGQPVIPCSRSPPYSSSPRMFQLPVPSSISTPLSSRNVMETCEEVLSAPPSLCAFTIPSYEPPIDVSHPPCVAHRPHHPTQQPTSAHPLRALLSPIRSSSTRDTASSNVVSLLPFPKDAPTHSGGMTPEDGDREQEHRVAGAPFAFGTPIPPVRVRDASCTGGTSRTMAHLQDNAQMASLERKVESEPEDVKKTSCRHRIKKKKRKVLPTYSQLQLLQTYTTFETMDPRGGAKQKKKNKRCKKEKSMLEWNRGKFTGDKEEDRPLKAAPPCLMPALVSAASFQGEPERSAHKRLSLSLLSPPSLRHLSSHHEIKYTEKESQVNGSEEKNMNPEEKRQVNSPLTHRLQHGHHEAFPSAAKDPCASPSTQEGTARHPPTCTPQEKKIKQGLEDTRRRGTSPETQRGRSASFHSLKFSSHEGERKQLHTFQKCSSEITEEKVVDEVEAVLVDMNYEMAHPFCLEKGGMGGSARTSRHARSPPLQDVLQWSSASFSFLTTPQLSTSFRGSSAVASSTPSWQKANIHIHHLPSVDFGGDGTPDSALRRVHVKGQEERHRTEGLFFQRQRFLHSINLYEGMSREAPSQDEERYLAGQRKQTTLERSEGEPVKEEGKNAFSTPNAPFFPSVLEALRGPREETDSKGSLPRSPSSSLALLKHRRVGDSAQKTKIAVEKVKSRGRRSSSPFRTDRSLAGAVPASYTPRRQKNSLPNGVKRRAASSAIIRGGAPLSVSSLPSPMGVVSPPCVRPLSLNIPAARGSNKAHAPTAKVEGSQGVRDDERREGSHAQSERRVPTIQEYSEMLRFLKKLLHRGTPESNRNKMEKQ